MGIFINLQTCGEKQSVLEQGAYGLRAYKDKIK